MTLVEFLEPLKNRSIREKILAALYYQHRYLRRDSLTVEQIRAALRSARVQKWARINIADALSKSGHFVDTPGLDGNRRLWRLTLSGERHIRSLLDLPAAEPEVEHEAASLSNLASTLSDPIVREYVEEAIKCLRVGALRAGIVFLWTGAIRTIQQEALSRNLRTLNSCLQRHDPRARRVSKMDDFAYIKDKTTLLAAHDLGIFDRGERGTLEEALDLRNRCGHPTNYKPRINKASSFIEDVVGIVFS